VYCEWDDTLQQFRVIFLTAGHCTKEFNTYSVLDAAEKWDLRGGMILETHEKQDLSLLVFYVDVPVLPCSYTSRIPSFGQKVYIAGYPLARRLLLTEGFMGIAEDKSSALAVFGNSGGAIMDSQGRVFGIVVGLAGCRYGPVYHMSRFEPLTSEILEWMHEIINRPGLPL
jgi:hypothetical protein